MKALFAIPALLVTAGLGFLFAKPAKAAAPAPAPEPSPDGGQDAPAPQSFEEPPLPGGGGGAPDWTQEPAPAPGFPPSGLWPTAPLQAAPPLASPGFPPMQLPTAPAQAPAQAPVDLPTQATQVTQAVQAGLPAYQAGTRTLKLTSPATKGTDVMALQLMLNKSGANPQLKLDGAYGAGTVAAVKRYQASRKLTADGVTGKATWASLISQLPAQATQTAATATAAVTQAVAALPGLPQHVAGVRTLRLTSPATKGSDVMALQVMLNGAGANPQLKLDGAYGSGTVAAVKKYQASRKLTADGVTGKGTWASLMSAVPSAPTSVATTTRVPATQLPTTVVPAVVAASSLPPYAPGSRTLKSTKPVMRGTDVLALQALLNESGASPQLGLDGSFGPSTLAAVKKFQASRGLTVDGQVGANTWSAFRKTGGQLAPEAPKPVAIPASVSTAGLPLALPGSRTLRAASPAMTGADVVAAQTLLNKAGAAPALKLDGVYGPGSVAAVKKYQKAKGLTADGILGATTWTSLKKYDAPAAAAPISAPVAQPVRQSLADTRAPANLPVFTAGSRTIRQKSPLMKGSDVWELQGLLNRAGYTPALTLDGVYGPAGVKAVRWFQSSRHLTIDGVVGPATWTALRSAVTGAQTFVPPAAVQQAAAAAAPVVARAAAAAPAIPALPSIPGLPTVPFTSRTLKLTSPATRGSDVLMLQGILNMNGANPPLVLDGAFGPAGVKAVKAFQTKNRLTADGVVGPATWAVLQGGSVGAILEDPLREAAQELTAHLHSIGGVTGVGREDASLVSVYQKLEGLRADGKYSPGDAARMLKHGIVPCAPFYWAPDEKARKQQREVFLAAIEKGKQLNPPQASLYDKLRADTLKRLGDVSR